MCHSDRPLSSLLVGFNLFFLLALLSLTRIPFNRPPFLSRHIPCIIQLTLRSMIGDLLHNHYVLGIVDILAS